MDPRACFSSFLFIASPCFLAAAPCFAQGRVELVSKDSNGVQADSDSDGAAISADGRVVAFVSSAGNLAPGDCPFAYDVFVRDRIAGTTELAAVTWDGSDSNQDSREPSLSADGRYVAFISIASNLDPNDLNGSIPDLFVRDRLLGITHLAALTSTGAQSVGAVPLGSISADGQWVVFESAAGDFVAGDTNGVSDVFVRNLATGAVERVSLRSDGTQALLESHFGSLSSDGRLVAFSSFDALVPEDNDTQEDVYVLNRATHGLRLVSPTYDGSPSDNECSMPVISLDGRTVVFIANDSHQVPGDTNHKVDVFWRDLFATTTGRASVTSSGAELDGFSLFAAVSGDGRTIGFWSTATGVVPGVPGLLPGYGRAYVHDRVTGATTLIDAAPSGEPGDSASEQHIALSFDGRYVAWDSSSSNLVPGDFLQSDVFLRERASDPPAPFCTAKTNSLGCSALIDWSGSPSASSGSPFVIRASNVIGGESGLLLYGLTSQSVPFQGGVSCVAPPTRRTPSSLAGGTPGTCSGVLSFDFNAWIASHADATLVAGTVVYAQFWYRDALDPFGTGLSNAIEFVIMP